MVEGQHWTVIPQVPFDTIRVSRPLESRDAMAGFHGLRRIPPWSVDSVPDPYQRLVALSFWEIAGFSG